MLPDSTCIIQSQVETSPLAMCHTWAQWNVLITSLLWIEPLPENYNEYEPSKLAI